MFNLTTINRDRLLSWGLAIALLLIFFFYGGWVNIANTSGPVRLVVYAFSTQEEVLTQRILPDFERTWEAETGRDLTVEAIFGPSGVLAGQINLGAPADVVVLSNEQHVNWLKLGRQVAWDSQPVVVSQTPIVIVTRPGNPAHLGDYADLAQPGLRLLHADPRRSGAGDWAVLAEYGSALLATGDSQAAAAQLRGIWGNVRLLAPSARASLTLFELGAGDALVTYEQDARLALERGVPLEIVIPPRTIVAEHVATIVNANVTPAERPAGEALVGYLLSEAGQQAFSQYHLRPADWSGQELPALVEPFTAATLGGWSRAYGELVESLWQQEIEPRLKLEPDVHLLEIPAE